MYAGNDPVGLKHHVHAGGRGEHRGVVTQSEGAGMARKRSEIMGDEAVFRGFR